MGLDSYLYLEKSYLDSEISRRFTAEREWRDTHEKGEEIPDDLEFEHLEYPKEIEDIIFGGENGKYIEDAVGKGKNTTVSYSIGYWRKMWPIHEWIVNNCADGVDECQQIYMTKNQVEILGNVCKYRACGLGKFKTKYYDPKMGMSTEKEYELPTDDYHHESWGDPEYEKWYRQELMYTWNLCQRILKTLEVDDAYKVIYQASW